MLVRILESFWIHRDYLLWEAAERENAIDVDSMHKSRPSRLHDVGRIASLLGEQMDENLRRRIYAEFFRIEDAFLELTQYIPLVPDLADPRYSIASPRTAEFGLECCTWIETLMRELLFDPRWDDKIAGIGEARLNDNLNIDIYRAVLGGKMHFDQAGYALRGLGGSEIRPFAEWAHGENPDWFKAYSRYKHDRIEFAERFAMGHALLAYVGLVILVNHWPPFSPGLANRDPSGRPFTRFLEGV